MDSITSGGIALLVTVTVRGRVEYSILSYACLLIGVYILSSLVIKITRAAIRPYQPSGLQNLPGPDDNHFLFGQEIKLMLAPGPLDLYLKWMHKWPDAPFIRHLSFGNSDVLLANSLEAHKQLLQTKCYSFVKPDFFRKLLGEFVGKGLLLCEGDEHKAMRRQLAGPFSIPNIRKLLPIFQEKAKDLSSYLSRTISDDAQGHVNIEPIYTKAMMNVIGSTIMGVELGNLTSSSSLTASTAFVENYHTILDPPLLGKLITFLNPLIPLRWLPLKANTEFLRANREIQGMLRELTQKRWAEVTGRKETEATDTSKDSRDVLTFMIETSLSEKVAWKEQEVVELLLQFVAAGHETTAEGLTLTTYLLAMNPDIQSRLREEIVSTLKEHPQPDYSAIENMHYLNNVTREGLRLMPPSNAAPREALEEVVIAGVTIPKGTTVTVIPAMIQRNPLVWGDDADSFRPERWDNLGPEASSPYALTAFNGGPRMCIGKAFATLAFKVMLVEVIRNFVIEPVDRELRFVNPSITLQPVGGLRIKVKSVS